MASGTPFMFSWKVTFQVICIAPIVDFVPDLALVRCVSYSSIAALVCNVLLSSRSCLSRLCCWSLSRSFWNSVNGLKFYSLPDTYCISDRKFIYECFIGRAGGSSSLMMVISQFKEKGDKKVLFRNSFFCQQIYLHQHHLRQTEVWLNLCLQASTEMYLFKRENCSEIHYTWFAILYELTSGFCIYPIGQCESVPLYCLFLAINIQGMHKHSPLSVLDLKMDETFPKNIPEGITIYSELFLLCDGNCGAFVQVWLMQSGFHSGV